MEDGLRRKLGAFEVYETNARLDATTNRRSLKTGSEKWIAAN
jgi:hypothetical protein